ncbi:unnamed protein product [Xylocopa violacea]|uniref:Uncharacterized protein n=1 Tax=Xylocopa violacea TaxID=135666 RepID=A0ABP1P0N6_XYLVO
MWNSKGRKVKSLNDIPEVFRTYDHVETKVSLEKIINKHNGELVQKKMGILFPQRININIENHFLEKQEFSDDTNNNEKDSDTEKRLKNAKTLKSNVDEQLKKMSLQEDSKMKFKKRILSVMDVLLSFMLVTPTIVIFWRSTWMYMEIHADVFPGWFIFTLGTLMHTTFAILKNYFHVCMTHESTKKLWLDRILCKSMKILYTYVFGTICVMQWSGAFNIFDSFIQSAWLTACTTSVAVIVLMIFRSVPSITAPPLAITVDAFTNVFYFPTRYKMYRIRCKDHVLKFTGTTSSESETSMPEIRKDVAFSQRPIMAVARKKEMTGQGERIVGNPSLIGVQKGAD